ncbi:hypothetical protein BCU59_07090 [Vibrio cyclitrophicus]|nr:hypothetical protein BCU59_07090 [Vibrio cyclitrophicus]
MNGNIMCDLQRGFKYPNMGTAGHGELTDTFVRMSMGRLAWAVVFFERDTNSPAFLLLEVNKDNDCNKLLSPKALDYLSLSSIPVYLADFVDKNYSCVTSLSNEEHVRLIHEMLGSSSTSHEYLTRYRSNYVTMDFDYTYISKDYSKSVCVEVTTLYKNMHSKREALRLLGYIVDRRIGGGNTQISSLNRAVQTLKNGSFLFLVCNSDTQYDSYVSVYSTNCIYRSVDANFVQELQMKSVNPSKMNFSQLTELLRQLEQF